MKAHDGEMTTTSHHNMSSSSIDSKKVKAKFKENVEFAKKPTMKTMSILIYEQV